MLFDDVVCLLAYSLLTHFIVLTPNRPEMWALTMEQLKSICEHPMYDIDMTMCDVVNKIVKPMTSGSGMSFARHCNKESPVRARVMVSHGKRKA